MTLLALALSPLVYFVVFRAVNRALAATPSKRSPSPPVCSAASPVLTPNERRGDRPLFEGVV